jgi:conserved domain protein|nr:MAG TPA: Pulmonary surfactant-associated protein [Caudoviricetes sp.]
MAETKTLQEILVTLGEKPLNVNVSIPGIKGEDGQDGQDGRNGTDGLSAYDIAQLNGFKGSQQEWLDSLKAGAVADEARTMLLNGNVWCKSNSIADVLAAVISNLGKAFPRTEFKPLTVGTVLKGQRVIAVEGEPHYFVKVAGMETQFEIDDNGTGSISIEPLGVDDVHLTYHNFIGEKVGKTVIAGSNEDTRTPDETYEENGVKYALFGRTLEINVVNFTGDFEHNFKFMGKCAKTAIDSILIKASRPTVLKIGAWYGRSYSVKDVNSNYIGNIPVLVDNPKNVTFENNDLYSTPIKLGSIEYGTSDVRLATSRIEWSDSQHKYVNTGDTIDNL